MLLSDLEIGDVFEFSRSTIPQSRFKVCGINKKKKLIYYNSSKDTNEIYATEIDSKQEVCLVFENRYTIRQRLEEMLVKNDINQNSF